MNELKRNNGVEREPGRQKQRTRFAVGSIELPGIDEPDFQDLFRHVPGNFVATRPDHTIAAASDDMLRKTSTWREEITGRCIFDVFPDNPSETESSNANWLEASLNEVLSNGIPSAVRVVRYDIQNRRGDGQWIEKFWTVLSRPVVDRQSGDVIYVLTEVRDVTRVVQLVLWFDGKECIEQLGREAQRSVQRIRGDVKTEATHIAGTRARIAEEMELTGATTETLLRELDALLRSPESRLYACAGEWVSESGVYVSYHLARCTFSPRVRYYREGAQFPACDHCGSDVLYRFSNPLCS